MAYGVFAFGLFGLWSVMTGFVPGFSGSNSLIVGLFFLFLVLSSGYIILKRFFPRLFMRSRR